MKYLSFLLFVYSLITLVHANSETNIPGTGIDGVALLLGIGAFVWVYIIYRDKGKKFSR